MTKKDYLLLIIFILETQKQRLTSESLKELIDLILKDEVDHNEFRSFIYDILE